MDDRTNLENWKMKLTYREFVHYLDELNIPYDIKYKDDGEPIINVDFTELYIGKKADVEENLALIDTLIDDKDKTLRMAFDTLLKSMHLDEESNE